MTMDGDGGGAAAVSAVLVLGNDHTNVLIYHCTAADMSNGNSNNNCNNNRNKQHLDVHAPVQYVPTDRTTLHQQVDYTPMTLQDIHDWVQDLCHHLPHVPESGFVLEEGEEEVEETMMMTTGVTPKQQQPPPEPANPSSLMHSSSSLFNNSEEDPLALVVAAATMTVTKAAMTMMTTRAPISLTQTLLQATTTMLACPFYDKEVICTWAMVVQMVLEEFSLLMACVSPATYVWGTDQFGAADQNLSW